jgi:hypothetical protein
MDLITQWRFQRMTPERLAEVGGSYGERWRQR